MKKDNHKSQILLYTTVSGDAKIEVKLDNETVWLNQEQMSDLFQTDRSSITKHLKNIYETGELDQSITCAKFAQHLQDGRTYDIRHYNLDIIISVGYRVKSLRGTQFRIWATERLKEYLVKGFTLNDDRFKSGNSMNYFNELQERIREIRLSERFFYQKIKDIYTTSIDYNSKDEKKLLGLLVEQYLAFAETMAQQRTPMYMQDWIARTASLTAYD